MSHKYPLSPITRPLLASFTWRKSLSVAALTAGLVCPAITQAQEFNLNIPSQSLDGALKAFGAQAKMQMQYNREAVKGVNTKGVQGRLTPSAALTTLLQDTGLSYQISGNIVSVSSNQANANQAQPTKQLAPVTVTAQAGSPSITEGTNSYTTKAVTIGKGEHSLKEIPQSITVITRQRMDEQNLKSVDEVLLQSTGITRENTNYGNLRYSARGFVIDNYQFDGVPIDDYGGISSPDMAIFDRVEVLRGASGLLNGNGQPAGTVNFVRKRPLAEKQLSINATVGSWDYYRTEIDATGPLNKSGTFRGRVVTSFEDRDYFYNTTHYTKPMIYGIFEADLGKKTTLMFGARHQTDDISGRWVRGLPRYSDGRSLDIPRSTSLGVDWSRYKNTTTEIFGELEHRFNDDWKGKITARRLEGDRLDKTASWFGTVDPITRIGLSWGSVDYETFKTDQNILDANLIGKFQAFGRTHEILLGANWQEVKSDTNSASLAQAQDIDIFNYNSNELREPAGPLPSDWFPSSEINKRHGIYSSLRFKALDSLTLIAGGRVSWYDLQAKDGTTGQVIYQMKHDNEFTPYAGIVYDLNKQWAVYASYTDIFRPQGDSFTLTADGKPLDPAIGVNYEAGIKGELFDGKLNTSFAVFRIEEDKRAQEVPCPVGAIPTNCYINGGKVRSDGFEAEINGELLPRWNLSAGYTYNTTKYLSDKDINGNPTTNQGSAYRTINPRHLVRVWTSYNLPGDWHKLTILGGVSAQSETYTNSGSIKITEPRYAIWSAGVNYAINNHWTAAVNVNNLFDKTYYAGSLGSEFSNNYYGEPRNVMLTLRGKF